MKKCFKRQHLPDKFCNTINFHVTHHRAWSKTTRYCVWALENSFHKLVTLQNMFSTKKRFFKVTKRPTFTAGCARNRSLRSDVKLFVLCFRLF